MNNQTEISKKDDYNLAIEYFNRSDFNAAENVLLKLLEQNYNDYDVLNFLGIIHLNLKNYKRAINYFYQVLSIVKNHAVAFYNLGFCLEQIGDEKRAIDNYKKTIETDPAFTDAYLNLGRVLIEKENFAEAEKLLTDAVQKNPGKPKLYNNLANLFLKLNKWETAVKYYNLAIKRDSINDDYYFNLGNCYSKMEQYDSAILNYKKAIEINPSNKGAINNLANVQVKINNYKSAIELYTNLIESFDDTAGAFYNLANCYQEQKNYDKAIEYYQNAIKKDKTLRSAYINIGRCFLEKGDVGTAEEYFLKATEDGDNRTIAFTNLAVTSLESLRINEALSFLEIVLKGNPDVVEAHYNKAHALLLNGNYDEGWKEYEWRKKRKDFIKPDLSKPELIDQPVENKKILVYAEQGFGDTIQFVRYLQLLKDKKCHIIFICDKKLYDLFKNLECIDKIIISDNLKESEIEYDYQIALMSLPFYFKTNRENIPAFKSYLKVDDNLVNDWKKIIKERENLKVGIVWAGNPNNNRDKIRSMKLSQMLPVLSLKGIDFYSLQVGPAANQLNDIYYPIVRLDNHIRNFTDTAAIIKNLDLVISVDTSVVHLSGALGKPVWNLVSFLPDWRWLLSKKDTAWYPSMRLYRQQEKGDWQSVINEVRYDLQKLLIERQDNYSNLSSQKSQPRQNDLPLYIGLREGENYGWGVCGKYLRKEIVSLVNTVFLDEIDNSELKNPLPGILFNPILNNTLKGTNNYKGIKTYGYTFFEYELTKNAPENAKQFDQIFAGSSWCRQKLVDAGIDNPDVLLQGIDPELFYPAEKNQDNNLFVIFSGGKFELRKSQDLVLKAFKILQEKYSDIILINAWYNLWAEVMETMLQSDHIKFEVKGNNWQEMMNHLYEINGIDSSRVFTLPLVPNEKMRELYMKSDVGLFPNRCEGGTNLVMMEYMACGKPVIASYFSGHTDVLNEQNSLLLTSLKDFRLFDNDDNLIADWKEPQIDEIIEKIEFAYHNRNKLKILGSNAGEFMKNFTWKKTAETLVEKINK